MIEPIEYRNVMGRFASGITIVSTSEGDQIHGMTANGFVSVSLHPPLVLVSIDHKAKMHQLLPKTRKYGISILKNDQEAVSRHFAGHPMEEAPSFFWREGLPFIENALAYVACEVVEQHEAGDHTLYIGQVEWLSYEQGGEPLIFFAGKYQKLELKGNSG
ncbi:flavin reductase family protein [Paenibacillus validus]|uniref:Flavin reductase n=1 Tax=Paenibacillus validus TaxID=44253 RepID=A0A7X2Z7U6_9BACL|nr:flavin reductase family protein [Paenibacillus validus]MED4600637.1 flavin reductase family protein [Paenibacillus validus]MED4606270.1 flavin reductase family protein [Paenibacillus validus]MUG69904.1 flavin reductase [Paenibacillus validus]